MKTSEGHFCLLLVIVIYLVSEVSGGPFSLYKESLGDYKSTWKDTKKTIYDGNSVKELLALCPSGCGKGCDSFVIKGPLGSSTKEKCEEGDIKVLRYAQELVKQWQEAVKPAKIRLIIHGSIVAVSFILILVLIFRGHYRFKDLFYVPTERQWELETDPTWGLPGKVWSLLINRVVKSTNKEPTIRKYLSYTENPTVMGEKFWSYKQALRDMYKSHKYYKRNRYFHKLAWQITKLAKVIPETLRRRKVTKRRAGEVEKVGKQGSTPQPELDPLVRLPWVVDLPDEMNAIYLRKAKLLLKFEVDKETASRRFINGRFQPNVADALRGHHHHHHHHHTSSLAVQLPPLTHDEIRKAAKELDLDPNADFVMVNDVMKLNPTVKGKGDKLHHHHHHSDRAQ